jgi:excisionase family DNA binding protein
VAKATATPQRELPSREDVLLTRREVAQLLGVNERWVQRALGLGYFPHVKVGKLVRVRRSDLDAYIAAQTRPATRGSK